VEVEAKPRPVRIHAMELEDLDPPRMRVLIRCSRGTYARVLAMEIGQALGTVGHLEALRRVASGPFHLNQAITLSRLADIVAGDPAWDRVLRPGGDRVPWRPREEVLAGLARHVTPARERLAHLPAVSLGAADARRLRQVGTLPPLPPGLTGKVALVEGDQVLAVVDATAPVAPRPPRRA
jgi:tRNA U55 pseudouridine synthase TruB